MQQPHEQRDPIDPIRPLIHGCAEQSTSVPRWDFPHPDILYSNQEEDHQVEEDSQVGEVEDFRVEETREATFPN